MAKTVTTFEWDIAGNWYGGADGSSGSAGIGDVVQDANGTQGTVTKIYKKDDGNYYGLVAVSLRAGGTLWENQYEMQEKEVRLRYCTILSHADGSGLVASGNPVTTYPGNMNQNINPGIATGPFVENRNYLV